MGGDTVRRRVSVRIPDGHAVAEFHRGTREQRAKLAAAEDAKHGSRFDDCVGHERRREKGITPAMEPFASDDCSTVLV